MTRSLQRWLIGITCAVLVSQHSVAANAAMPTIAVAQASAASGDLPPCPDPGVCFISGDARNEWARTHNCRFNDVQCEDTEPQASTGGLVATASAILRFAQGLVDGLAQQLGDIWNFFRTLFTNPSQTWNDLTALGKAIIEDPLGALQAFFDLLGEDISKFRFCGSYDRGKVVGKYVSPFFALKVAKLVAQTGKRISEAVDIAKKTKVGPESGLPRVPGSLVRLDVKQPNGRSWFELTDATERGRQIEIMLGHNLPSAFPTIDRISGRVVTSTKSYDLTKPSLATAEGWRNRLREDLQKLADFTEGEQTWERGTPRAGERAVVQAVDFDRKVLEVVIRKGEMTEEHYAVLQQARAYAAQLLAEGRTTKPIQIVVVEIF